MIERRNRTDRRMGTDRRKNSDRRVNDINETAWLPPYGRRKLDRTDARKGERRISNRRVNY